ncbi:MAG: hypothetical protein ACON3Z_14965 [Bradymonadia bacterium]
MSRRHRFVIGFIVCGTGLLGGCGPTQVNLTNERKSVSQLEKELKRADRSARVEGRYEQALKSQKNAFVAVGRDAMLQAMKRYMPYRFEGAALSKKRLSGKLRFERPRDLTFEPGNRVRFKMSFAGKNIRANLKGIFGAGRSDEQKIREALEAGGHFDLEVHLRLGQNNTEVWMTPTIKAVNLVKHNSSRHRKFLLDALRGKFFRYPLRLKLPAALHSRHSALLTTEHHIVVVFGSK